MCKPYIQQTVTHYDCLQLTKHPYPVLTICALHFYSELQERRGAVQNSRLIFINELRHNGGTDTREPPR